MATTLLTFSSLKGTNISYEATTQKTSLHVSRFLCEMVLFHKTPLKYITRVFDGQLAIFI